jgi:SAM-dependent methyltransferase
MTERYIHGSSETERKRLALMNSLINPICIEALGLGREERVLDMGAGTGLFTRLIGEQLPAGSLVIGVERNPEQAEAALNLPEATGGCAVEFRIGDATDPPLNESERGRFDLAHARFLLEHVPDPAAVVRAMVAAVKPGGRIVLADDDHDLMRFWPEPEGLMKAWQAYYRSYRFAGTDPLIGRKLAGLLHDAGARPSRITQLFYGACAGSKRFHGIVDNLIGVLEGARTTVLAAGEISAADYDDALDNFRAFRERPNAALWYVINWAEGWVLG